LTDETETELSTDPNAADSDRDGINDSVETNNGAAIDRDDDGTIDALDDDSDGDGILDSTEAVGDADDDGTANYRDLDSDEDGIDDEEEDALGTDPYDADSDDDGIPDGVETTRLDGTGPGEVVDTDGDGTIDGLNSDSGGDRTNDATEATGDNDGDGTPDYRVPKDDDGPDGDFDAVDLPAIDEKDEGHPFARGSY
jgi:hypothetical protein